ncbi:MAG: cytochrome c family protein [Myxococcota bacterium]
MSARPFMFMLTLAGMTLAGVMAGGRESAEESEYVGAAQCSQCHQAEYEAWQKSAHARALERLSEAERKDPRCRQCHTTAPDENDPALAGVQCEACHGRGRYYSARWIMKDPELRQTLYMERGNAETCARCHNDTAPSIRPFDYATKMQLIRHGPVADGGVATPDAGAKP